MGIDKDKVIEKTLALDVTSNEEGLIPFFGVKVQRLPTEFWNSFARRIVNNVPEDLVDAAEGLLVNAAKECAYHTAHGVILSQEWTSIVSTMVKTIEEMMVAPFIAFAAWGWGDCEVVELEPKKKMIVRAHDYYESDIVTYGKSGRPCAYMLQGLCAALMDLGYGKAYPDGIGTFHCVQTKGIELGDQYGEFLVTKV
jgi:hypothetical protein